MVTIYLLKCPDNGIVKYVGKTKNPLSTRLREHIRCALKGIPKGSKSDWIRGLLVAGRNPIIEPIEICGLDNWRERERYWCASYNGLLNKKAAGGGGDSRKISDDEWDIIKDWIGKISDSRVADMIGVTRKSISYYRKQMGILESGDRSNNKPPPRMGGHNKKVLSLDVIWALGSMPDHKLAALHNVSKKRIMKERQKYGIESYGKRTGNDGKIKIGEQHRRWG